MPTWVTVTTELRSVARRLGLTQPLLALHRRVRGASGYEPKVMAFLESSIGSGDTVWDVGANVGQFGVTFSDLAGPEGRVICFEPAPDCFAALVERTQDLGNLTALDVALGHEDGVLVMHLAEDPEGTINTFLPTRDDTPNSAEVSVRRGDAIRRTDDVPMPNVLKIDVEGYEQEVLQGLEETLRDPACRAVLCEVHFSLLASRGKRHAPSEIHGHFKALGFSLAWVTPSHLGARRVAG